MSKKLFVGNLPWSATNDDLQQLFAQHGNVISANVITDKFSGRSKGFGFVEFEKEEEAQSALQAINGQDFQGRNIAVSEARPMADRPPRKDFGGRRDQY
ncbi:MAG: RNA-binding protein [Candidatus Doudnabacteria bacterium CG10_big_fil_rev_8_21_14_0_10_42_18]|uniref:RNA-binding protein n=1 Tax=Candidatus Doudnabacteria bacterium CG10_big_fil_rev_8_21_14_0_10_42_18 TaxID=1974552 RepID=A0A2H0VAW7_9BACT|nr:MAG: RNA-binding protein [Candidatus Doudnabacteria bacterium CG10_big_fil_rev_8_21_14_0_10_42_18]